MLNRTLRLIETKEYVLSAWSLLVQVQKVQFSELESFETLHQEFEFPTFQYQ